MSYIENIALFTVILFYIKAIGITLLFSSLDFFVLKLQNQKLVKIKLLYCLQWFQKD